MPAPLIGVAVGTGARWVGQRLLQHGAQQLTRQGLQNQAGKQAFGAASGLGVFNASPAQAPGLGGPDRAQVSREATAPDSTPSIPDFSGTFNGAP
jgi:hypothetical protein